MHCAMIGLLMFLPGGAPAAKDSCFDCHSVMEGTSVPFRNDIHYKNGISCADCHGGDRNSDDQNVSMSAERGFQVRVTRDATSEYCARCHSDAAAIHKHNPNQRLDQLALYRTSVHAGKPAASESVAANCVDCHGVHNIRAVNDPRSAVAPERLAGTCGKCHPDASSMFAKSAHAGVFASHEMPACATCHAGHATERASGEMLAGGRSVCARCHEPDTKAGRTAAALERTFERLMRTAFSAGTPGTGMRGAFNASFRKARSAVHSLNVDLVRTAGEAAMPNRQ